jgi:acyl phosphate:glycerol-3-phosphate acyltransferase
MGILTPVIVGVIAAGYIFGALPFGFWIAKFFYGVDIRVHGSGNTGATNVWRTLGKKPGSITLLLDILKGVLPVLLARRFTGIDGVAIATGLAAIIGHNWSLFLRGRGGKGVATSAGVFLALIPLQTLAALGVFGIGFGLTKRVSVGSLAACVALLICVMIMETSFTIRVTVLAAGLMMLAKHIPNIKRIAAGTEPKVSFK